MASLEDLKSLIKEGPQKVPCEQRFSDSWSPYVPVGKEGDQETFDRRVKKSKRIHAQLEIVDLQ